MRRVSVVGTSGAGKTTVGTEIARRLGVPHIELDALYHRPDWQPTPREEIRETVGALIDSDGWVVDGNYRSLVQDMVWEAADTVVWIDPPRPVVMMRVVRRTLARGLLRRELWNGNRESLRSLLRADPEENIVLWAWKTYEPNRERYRLSMSDADRWGVDFIRLRTRRETRGWLESIDVRPPGET